METTSGSRSASLGWMLAFFVPLSLAIVLQWIASRQTDLHAAAKLSIIGNIFLAVSLIVQSVYLLRKSTKWGILMLIVTSALLGFGLCSLLRVR